MGGHSPLLHIGHPRKRNGARYTFLSKWGGHSPLLHTGHPQKRNGTRYIPSPLGGGRSPLLHTGHPQKRNGTRYIPSPLGGKVAGGRMRGHKGTVESRQHLYVMLNLFQHLANVAIQGKHKNPSPEFLSSRSSLRNSTLPLTKTIHRNVFVRQSPRGEE